MTTAEIIKKTEYTETQLIEMALVIAARQMKKFRDEPDNNAEDWDHYNDLAEAFHAIYHERTGR